MPLKKETKSRQTNTDYNYYYKTSTLKKHWIYTVEIGQNTKKSPGDLRGLADNQTPVLMLV